MPDSPNNEAPRKARKGREPTADEIAEAKRRYLAGTHTVEEFARPLGIDPRWLHRAMCAQRWQDTRDTAAAADARFQSAKAGEQAKTNRRQAEVSRLALDVVAGALTTLAKANETDPESARKTLRAIGSIKGVADVERLAVDLVTDKTDTGAETLSSLLTKIRERLNAEATTGEPPGADPGVAATVGVDPEPVADPRGGGQD